MKRKPEEVFNYHGLRMQVEATITCRGCYFNRVVKGIHECCQRDRDITGSCVTDENQSDWVKFVVVGVIG